MDEEDNTFLENSESVLLELGRPTEAEKGGKPKKKGKVSEEEKKKKEEEKRILRRLVDDRLNIEDFITEVEKHPSLWKTEDESYSNKHTKLNDWIMVTSTFITNFEEHGKSQKEEILRLVMAKWKHLRGCYTREILKKKEEQKSGSASTRRKPYLYFEHLRFLETLKKNTDDSIFDSEKNEDEVAEEANNDPEISTGRQDIHRKKKRNSKEEDELLDDLKKRYVERNMRRNKDEEDGDKLFLLSLLPELKRVAPEKKLQLKSDMLSMIASAQSFQTHTQTQIPQYPYRNFNPGPMPYQYSSIQEINPFQGHNQMQYPLDHSKYAYHAPTMPSNNYQPTRNQIQQERPNSVASSYQQNHHQSKTLDICRENSPPHINTQDPTMQQIANTAQSTCGTPSNQSSIYSPESEDYPDLF